jgi:hypothetical protein
VPLATMGVACLGWPNCPMEDGLATPLIFFSFFILFLFKKKLFLFKKKLFLNIFYFLLYSVTCQLLTSAVDTWQIVNIWTKNVTEVPNGLLPVTQIPLMKQMKT